MDGVRRCVPHATVLLLLALSLTPLPFLKPLLGTGLAGLLHVMPPLALIGVAYWSVQRPDRFGIMAAFLIGLLQDLLTGAPPGVTGFLYALLHRLAFRQHHALRGLAFLLLWSLFGAVQVGTVFIQWSVWAWLGNAALPLGPFLLQAMLGILLFPAVSWCLLRVQAATARNEAGRAA